MGVLPVLPVLNVRRVGVGAIAIALVLFGQTARGQRPAPSPSSGAEAIVPFKIQVTNAALTDLKDRLARARYADELTDAGWDYGMNLAYLKSLVAYWRDKYDWRAEEKRLNQFDQFTTVIDGVQIHFIHQRSKNPNAMPVLLLNGWPSSITEYEKVIGPLTDPVKYGGRVEDSFDVIVPSMPGFGFSGKPKERGYDLERIAHIWTTLMARLGYARYGVHGSDWGAMIGTRMALNEPAHLSGLHLAGCGAAPALPGAKPVSLSSDRNVNAAHGRGYQEEQSTKPQTIGQGLSDSPVALASWIVEKMYGAIDHDGDVEKVFSKDDLLNNVMIYWATNSGASSARLYYESRHIDGGFAATPFPQRNERVTVPTGCGAFPKRYDQRDRPAITDTPEARKVADARYNIVYFTTMPRGGHYPAFEQPTLWTDDVRTFFRDRR